MKYTAPGLLVKMPQSNRRRRRSLPTQIQHHAMLEQQQGVIKPLAITNHFFLQGQGFVETHPPQPEQEAEPPVILPDRHREFDLADRIRRVRRRTQYLGRHPSHFEVADLLSAEEYAAAFSRAQEQLAAEESD